MVLRFASAFGMHIPLGQSCVKLCVVLVLGHFSSVCTAFVSDLDSNSEATCIASHDTRSVCAEMTLWSRKGNVVFGSLNGASRKSISQKVVNEMKSGWRWTTEFRPSVWLKWHGILLVDSIGSAMPDSRIMNGFQNTRS